MTPQSLRSALLIATAVVASLIAAGGALLHSASGAIAGGSIRVRP